MRTQVTNAVLQSLATGALCGGWCCATTPAAVPVSGTAADLSQLAGEWSGDYWGASNGRSGAISFHLEAGSDSAHGGVTMIQRSLRAGPGSSPGAQPTAPAPMTTQELTVTFVHAEAGGVSGRLDPYTDPECHCTAFTTFTGRMKGGVIEGTFTTSHGGSSQVATGRWKVRRRKS